MNHYETDPLYPAKVIFSVLVFFVGIAIALAGSVILFTTGLGLNVAFSGMGLECLGFVAVLRWPLSG